MDRNKFKTDFDRDVADGEYIECVVEDRYWCRAFVEQDNNFQADDDYDPAACPKDYKSKARWYRAIAEHALAQRAYEAGDWWYADMWIEVVLWPQRKGAVDEDGWTWDDAMYEHLLVDKWAVCLGGVDVNHPTFDKRRRPNRYLRSTANDLLGDAIVAAKEAEHRLIVAKLTGKAA